ncbi:synaptonemal complex protein 3 [Hypomesus transpacificus]|uniref:synaptonemal complex protein 3 n=1 Tax=Hypomesus transpacificus TaxID=137520 RepID=UPI001F082521|nr:synaptonemal complex protein 3 [Hypomesus transpacificus]XP_046881822.1 synaptonemal complex protein 3 [Hypomesus transpacificus]
MATNKGCAQKAKTKGHITASSHPHGNDMNESVTEDAMVGRKRIASEEEDNITEGGNVTKMLDRFGADITKAFQAKRKRLETFTKASVKTSNHKIEQLWKTQQKDRSEVTEAYSTQFNAVFTQWDTDVQKSKEQEEKLLSMFQHQQKMFQHMKASQSQRLKTLKQLLEQYIQSLEAMEKNHTSQLTAVQGDLRQEMALFQKKILMDTQQQEMATVRKSLQSLLM